MTDINPMQAYIDAKSAEWQKERSNTQLTLGKAIETLKAMDNDTKIVGLGELMSYRGYYCDLAFEPGKDMTAGELLEECQNAMGRVFQGYKGGDYLMGETTPLWVAEYGDCGLKLMAINPDGTIETQEDEY